MNLKSHFIKVFERGIFCIFKVLRTRILGLKKNLFFTQLLFIDTYDGYFIMNLKIITSRT